VLGRRPCRAEAAVLDEKAWLLRFSAEGRDRLLIVNLGLDLSLAPIAEPLLAPAPDYDWQLLWSSEDPLYGGVNVPLPGKDGIWCVPGQSAIVLASAPTDAHG
jgi:maltooligosyltrehalose trehalohydrolase